MKVVVMIPSRLASSRFPNKPLAKIRGREMILHVCDRVLASGYEPIVVTPDKRIANLVDLENYGYIMTGDCCTGTDRVAEAAKQVSADIFVNVQGDEPVVRIEDIQAVVKAKTKHPDCVIGSMQILNRNGPNVVKVMCNAGQLIDMTREGYARFAQCGLYAFNKRELYEFYSVPDEFKKESLRDHENIELMRFVDLGMKVRMVEVQGSPAVDIPDDIKTVMEVMNHGR